VTLDEALERIGRVRRRVPYPYGTSWPIEQLELVRPDGTELRVLVKRLDGSPPLKPELVVHRGREIEAYGLLEGRDLGTPRCYASGRWWLVVEKVPGVELWQRGDLEAWKATASWAAALHETFAADLIEPTTLLRHNEGFYRALVQRARAQVGSELKPLAAAVEHAIGRLTRLPTTLIHGELYPSNVLIAERRVAVVDWEMAALGPGVIDLAALLTGWEPSAQKELIRAYGAPDLADVAAAQLLLAYQWLGWGDGWEAPAEHRRDWLAEARDAAEQLG
jgi:hypothetical protein